MTDEIIIQRLADALFDNENMARPYEYAAEVELYRDRAKALLLWIDLRGLDVRVKP